MKFRIKFMKLFFFVLENYYSKSEGPSISFIIESHLNLMRKIVKSVNSNQVLDTEEAKT